MMTIKYRNKWEKNVTIKNFIFVFIIFFLFQIKSNPLSRLQYLYSCVKQTQYIIVLVYKFFFFYYFCLTLSAKIERIVLYKI